MPIHKIKQPFFSRMFESRGMDPISALSKCIREADSRFDGFAKPKSSWIHRFVWEGTLDKRMGRKTQDYEKEVVQWCMEYVLKKSDEKNGDSGDRTRYVKGIAKNKVQYPKELTVYEIILAANICGVDPKELLMNIYDGFGSISNVELKRISRKEDVEYLKMKEDIRSLRIKNTMLRKEIDNKNRMLKECQEGKN